MIIVEMGRCSDDFYLSVFCLLVMKKKVISRENF